MTNTTTADIPVTFVEKFELLAPLEEFQEKATAFSRRIEKDGIPDLLSYYLYATPGSGEAFLVILFANAAAFEAHIDFIFSGIEEMKPYNETFKITKLWILGPLTEKLAGMFQRGKLPYEWSEQPIAGFVR